MLLAAILQEATPARRSSSRLVSTVVMAAALLLASIALFSNGSVLDDDPIFGGPEAEPGQLVKCSVRLRELTSTPASLDCLAPAGPRALTIPWETPEP